MVSRALYSTAQLLLLALLLATSSAYVSKGTLDSLDSWAFIDRFCFVPHEFNNLATGEAPTLANAKKYGLFQYSFKFPSSLDLYMLVYYDKEGMSAEEAWDSKGWGSVYVDEDDEEADDILSCSERYYHAAAKFRLKIQQNTHIINTNSQKDMVASGFAYFKSASPKYFFVAMSNCNPSCSCDPAASACSTNHSNTVNFCDGPLVLDYDFSFTNGVGASDKHFGYDEIGCLAISWVFFTFYVKYHVTVKLVVWSIWLMMAAMLFRLYHYVVYSGDGIGNKALFLTASILASASEILLVVHFILIAKGWTIVRRKISASGRVKIAAFTTVYAFLHISTTLFSEYFIDRGNIVYMYETPPGIILQSTRAFAAIWFLRCINTTMSQFPNQKRGFYKKYTIVFGLWFLWMVVNTWISMGVPQYMRFKFSYAFELSIIFSGHLILCIMYNPTFSAASSFPFHSNASHEIMTGRWNEELFKKELAQPRTSKRQRNSKRSDGIFNDDRGKKEEPSAPSQFPDVPAAAAAASQKQQQQLSSEQAAGGQLPNAQDKVQYAFATVSEATGYVREASDDVSALLHMLISNLDVLDDAMDDWDDDVGGELGEAYDDLGDDGDEYAGRYAGRLPSSRRGDGVGRHIDR